MSLYLPEQKLGSHSTEGSHSNKFMLKGRQTGSMHRGHSWVFRAESYETMLAWFEDIKVLTEKSPKERTAFVHQHARTHSGTSHTATSVSSDGIVDEEDEEPFSASASAVAIQTPKQDGFPRRPQPGGRFPSANLINSQLDLQDPLSLSSESSGFPDARDHDEGSATGAVPGSEIGQHYGEDLSSSPSPTHVAMVNQYAQQDGINPYTDQPIHNSLPSNHTSSEQAAAGLTTAGLGGTAFGIGGTEAYHNQQEEKFHKLEDQAALEASTIAAPDTYAQYSEAQAAHEAALVAAPDTPDNIPVVPADEKSIPRGHSTDEPASDASPEQYTTDAKPQNVPNPPETAPKPLTDDTAGRSTVADGQKRLSLRNILHLHIPGEFPKAAPT